MYTNLIHRYICNNAVYCSYKGYNPCKFINCKSKTWTKFINSVCTSPIESTFKFNNNIIPVKLLHSRLNDKKDLSAKFSQFRVGDCCGTHYSCLTAFCKLKKIVKKKMLKPNGIMTCFHSKLIFLMFLTNKLTEDNVSELSFYNTVKSLDNDIQSKDITHLNNV